MRLDPPTPIADGGNFGSWSHDADGLPVFEYKLLADGDVRRVGGLVLPRDDPRVPWHLLGNMNIKALVHAGGWCEVWATSRGFIRLTAGPGPVSTWMLDDGDGNIILNPTDTGCDVDVTFGTHFVTWRAFRDGITVRRTLSLDPTGVHPIILLGTAVDGAPDGAVFIESWPISVFPLFVGGLMSNHTPAFRSGPLTSRLIWDAMLSLTSASRTLTDLARKGAAQFMAPRLSVEKAITAALARPAREAGIADSASLFDMSTPIVYLAPVGQGSDAGELSATGDRLSIRTPVKAGQTMRAILGLAADEADIRDALETTAKFSEGLKSAAVLRASWHLDLDPESAGESAGGAESSIARESAWHAACLRSLETYDDYFESCYPSQASAYGFIHGLQGAPRDYALSAIPLAFIDSEAARDTIEVMMRMSRPDGAMHYAHAGRGQVISGGLHSYPSDLPIFLLWALTEYVWTTGDSAFLDAVVPFYPKERGTESTVADRIGIAFRQLRDSLGTGEHGLLRVGSGDWSDPISAMAPNRKAFHEAGESGFNTAFGVYSIERAAELIRDREGQLALDMEAFATDLREAMADTFNGRWFLRGWDGSGGPIGDDHLFLDGQVWPLIAGLGSKQERASLVQTIQELLIEPSAIGATILDRPHWVRMNILPPGWDCNGGIWAAINALLAWGLSLEDSRVAWDLLERQTLARHARAYPHVWYGIWSGPDSYNSWMGEREGETFVQPATPMAEFPVANSNAHSGPLIATLRVLGIETTKSGPRVIKRPHSNDLDLGNWRLTTAVGEFSAVTGEPGVAG